MNKLHRRRSSVVYRLGYSMASPIAGRLTTKWQQKVRAWEIVSLRR